jgi:hypothetical protein
VLAQPSGSSTEADTPGMSGVVIVCPTPYVTSRATGRQMEPIGQHDGEVRRNVVFSLVTPDNTGLDQ